MRDLILVIVLALYAFLGYRLMDRLDTCLARQWETEEEGTEEPPQGGKWGKRML